jgi:hypothetical protein
MALAIEPNPIAGTLAALKSVAEAHYGNALISWALQEVTAGRPPGDDSPPSSLRRQFLTSAYRLVLNNLQDHGPTPNPYREPLEKYRDQAIASVGD